MSINGISPIPSDNLPQSFAPIVFVVLYYLGTSICFVVVTAMLVLYFYFRKEPAVRASSVSLSVLIFIGCYMLIFYLLILNSTLLPSYHMRSSKFRNFICVFRVWIHGLGYPNALILSTLLVRLLRVYRIFNCYGKLSKYTSGNIAMAVYTLLITSPNGLICLVWSTSDHYLSEVIFPVRGGYVFVIEQCRSNHTIQWLLGLLIYFLVISLFLVVVGILTRNVKHKNFKDTKKVSALSFAMVFTLSVVLSYWYILRIIGANVVLVHAVLQIGHYCIILECQGFIFAPKLFPIIKQRLIRSYPKPKVAMPMDICQ